MLCLRTLMQMSLQILLVKEVENTLLLGWKKLCMCSTATKMPLASAVAEVFRHAKQRASLTISVSTTGRLGRS